MKYLITGGTGYIGSHIAAELLGAGHDTVLADNFCNSTPGVAKRVEKITGKPVVLSECDVSDSGSLSEIFSRHKIDGVIHCAGYKAVGESVANPLIYYRNNLLCTIALLETMREFGTRSLVFSSSATVYGTPKKLPLSEDAPLGECTNPYGQTKAMSERIITDFCAANPDFSAVLLRYFNPVGAHKSGLIGEKPSGIPNNLMPFITQTAKGIRSELSVFGDDYSTKDGTGVRDYIHVADLAKGHLAAIGYAGKNSGVETFNLGTGRGFSVLEMINNFENVNGLKIPYKISPRRPGDIAECYADVTKAKEILHWEAELGIEDMCRDAWNWELNSPRKTS